MDSHMFRCLRLVATKKTGAQPSAPCAHASLSHWSLFVVVLIGLNAPAWSGLLGTSAPGS